MDGTLHNIGAHEDGEYEGIEYVRMTQDERSKENLIASLATSLALGFQTASVIQVFDTGTLSILNSDSVSWEIIDADSVRAHFAFPAEAAHQHYYDVTPVHADLVTPDYQNYKVASVLTRFMEGSLRVYVNGIRLSETDSVYTPDSVISNPWVLNSYEPDHENGRSHWRRRSRPAT